MAYETLQLEIADGVAVITLDRPKSFNALNLALARELLEVANRIGDDPAVRAAVLTGAGDKAFCAGGDVATFDDDPAVRSVLLKEITGALHVALSRFAWMDAPLIGAINGVAAGAGLGLAACCDLAIAADTARFTSAYTAIGLTPDGSSTWTLSRLVGRRRAMELFLTNRTLSAAEALDWGLVNKVVPAASLRDEALALARQLAAGPTRAYGGVKKLLNMAGNDTLESQMERETRSIVAMGASDDGREGVRAFVGKRKPHFTGR